MNYNPRETYMNTALIAANILYFLILSLMGNTETDINMMLRMGALYEPYLQERQEYWRLFTACFMHFGIQHLINNMIVLFAVGDTLERALGHVKYLLFYLAAGILANICSVCLHHLTGDIAVSAGASGAVFGIVGGLLYVLLRNGGRLENMSVQRLFTMAVLSVYLGYMDHGVDNAAHVGGLISGFLLAMLFYRKKRRKTEWDLM